jgi:hypothetical protein
VPDVGRFPAWAQEKKIDPRYFFSEPRPPWIKNAILMVVMASYPDPEQPLVLPPAIIGESTVKGIAYYNIWYNFSVIKHMNFSNPN